MVRAKAENGRRQVRESGVQTRRRWPESQKLQIVRESHKPGAVMLEIARENGLHPSLLTKWRAQHRDGMLGTVSDAGGAARLLPVQVSTGPGNYFRTGNAARQFCSIVSARHTKLRITSAAARRKIAARHGRSMRCHCSMQCTPGWSKPFLS